MKTFIISKSRYSKGSYTFLEISSKEEYRLYSSKKRAETDFIEFIAKKEYNKYKSNKYNPIKLKQ